MTPKNLAGVKVANCFGKIKQQLAKSCDDNWSIENASSVQECSGNQLTERLFADHVLGLLTKQAWASPVAVIGKSRIERATRSMELAKT